MGKIAWAALALILGYAIFIAGVVHGLDAQPEQVCVPLYSETGYECCE